MKLLQHTTLLVTGLLLLVSNALASDIPTYNGYINDHAKIFSTEEISSLTQQVTQIEKLTTAEIAVLTIPTTDGIDISSYATEVGHTWKVGKKDKDNGIIIVIAIDDRQWFIATGYGVEGILPDLRTKQIAEVNFPANFQTGNYYDGISRGIHDIGKFLEQDKSIISKYSSLPKSNPKKPPIGELPILLVFAGLFIGNAWSKRKKSRAAIVSTVIAIVIGFLLWGPTIEEIIKSVLYGIGAFIFSFLSLISKGGGFFLGGRGGGFGSGGGFGGFGGGGFGGGGSGGRW